MLRGYINSRIACHPSLFIPIYRRYGEKKHLLINEKTKIVIEGFERSANTFAVVAFMHAQKKPVPMAHHLHVPAQVLAGIKRKLPVLVLIRNPADAIKSLKIMYPDMNVDNALKRYITFYDIIASNIHKVVIGKFEDVISDYGSVIQKINKKFNSEFGLFNHTAEEEIIIFEEVEKICAKQNLDELKSIAVPMEERNRVKNNIKLVYSKKLMQEAVCIYEEILGQT